MNKKQLSNLELRKLVREEIRKVMNERATANLAVMADKRLGSFGQVLRRFQRKTSSAEWKKKLAVMITQLETLHREMDRLSYTMGDIPL